MIINNFLGFYSEKDPETGYLSNWYKCKFTIDGIEFTSSEQYLMYMKAVTFHDEEQKMAILATDDQRTIKACGRAVKNFDGPIWNGVRQFVMYDALMAKFSQNEELKQKLISTGDAFLAECTYKDTVWATGCDLQTPECVDTTKWHGTNLLGFTLMRVREELK